MTKKKSHKKITKTQAQWIRFWLNTYPKELKFFEYHYARGNVYDTETHGLFRIENVPIIAPKCYGVIKGITLPPASSRKSNK